jgi:ribosomal protein S18 acetylase RimI-like enzyme
MAMILAASRPKLPHSSSRAHGPMSRRKKCRIRASISRIDVHAGIDDNDDYFVERSSSKARALDVKVFRGFSSSAREYASEQRLVGNDLSEERAVDFLMKDHDEDGNYVMEGTYANDGPYVPETYFVAIYNGTVPSRMESFARQNGIVGVVSAQPRASLVADDDDSPTAVGLPSIVRPIPSPHVYVANMRVDERMQRRGVAMALLSSVISWNARMHGATPMVLSVDNDNVGAIRLYEKFGFDYLEQNSHYCVMILRTS